MTTNAERMKNKIKKQEETIRLLRQELSECETLRKNGQNSYFQLTGDYDAMEETARNIKEKLQASAALGLRINRQFTSLTDDVGKQNSNLKALLLGFIYAHCDDDEEEGRSHSDFSDDSRFVGTVPLSKIYRFFRHISRVCFVTEFSESLSAGEKQTLERWLN
jgi:hypothetical protein